MPKTIKALLKKEYQRGFTDGSETTGAQAEEIFDCKLKEQRADLLKDEDKLECEAMMVGAMILNLRFAGMTHKKCDEFLKMLKKYIFSKYKPDEMKLRKILIEKNLSK